MSDLLAFLAVARERSFTRAAAKLGMSRSALSHTLPGLEARLGLRLLTRTTRSVAPTAAGERLLETAGHRIEEVEAELEALSELRDKPAGTIRITATEYASNSVLFPKLAKLCGECSLCEVAELIRSAVEHCPYQGVSGYSSIYETDRLLHPIAGRSFHFGRRVGKSS